MNAIVSSDVFIQRERYSDALAQEILPLLRQNWRESESYKPEIEIDPDFARYRYLDEHDMLLVYTARCASRLVGYAIWYVVTSFNYKGFKDGGLKSAHGTALYVEPDWRGHGAQLLRQSEGVLRARGIQRFYWFVPPASYLRKILEACGYAADEVLMEKLK